MNRTITLFVMGLIWVTSVLCFSAECRIQHDNILSLDGTEKLYIKGKTFLDDGNVSEGVNILYKAGRAYYELHEYKKAKCAYNEIVTAKDLSLSESLEATRMIAQISFVNLKDHVSAKQACIRILENTGGIEEIDGIFENNSKALLARDQSMYFLGRIHEKSGNYKEAISIQKELIKQHSDLLDEGVVRATYINNALSFKQLGQYKEAVQWYNSFIEKHPKEVNLKILHQRVMAHGYERGSQSHIDLLKTLWAQPEYQKDIWRFNIGRELLGSLFSGGQYKEALNLAYELSGSLNRFTEEERQQLSMIDREMLETAHSECLYYMADTQLKLLDISLAERTFNQLIKQFPDSPCAMYAKEQLVEIRKILDDADVDALEHLESNISFPKKSEDILESTLAKNVVEQNVQADNLDKPSLDLQTSTKKQKTTSNPKVGFIAILTVLISTIIIIACMLKVKSRSMPLKIEHK